jgi:hypothetical protein
MITPLVRLIENSIRFYFLHGEPAFFLKNRMLNFNQMQAKQQEINSACQAKFKISGFYQNRNVRFSILN